MDSVRQLLRAEKIGWDYQESMPPFPPSSPEPDLASEDDLRYVLDAAEKARREHTPDESDAHILALLEAGAKAAYRG